VTDTEPKPPADLLIVDVESTSLVDPWLPHGRRVWEIGALLVDGATLAERDALHVVISDVSLADASDESLRLGRFHERHIRGGGHIPPTAVYWDERRAAAALAALARSATVGPPWIQGANVGFDEQSLKEMLWRHRLVDGTQDCWPWYHHNDDLLAYAAGACGLRPPWGTSSIAEAVGVPREAAGLAHEALADARWCLLVLRALAERGSDLTAVMDAVTAS
jgi:hypothetical protein